MEIKCKTKDCNNTAAHYRLYCSRECAPYGTETKRVERSSLSGRKAMLYDALQGFSAQGKTVSEVSELLGMAESSIRSYGSTWGFKFKPNKKFKPDPSLDKNTQLSQALEVLQVQIKDILTIISTSVDL